jgi:hypothetical protein
LSCKNNAETTTPTPKQPIHLSQQAPAKKHEKKKHEKKKKKKKKWNLFEFVHLCVERFGCCLGLSCVAHDSKLLHRDTKSFQKIFALPLVNVEKSL